MGGKLKQKPFDLADLVQAEHTNEVILSNAMQISFLAAKGDESPVPFLRRLWGSSPFLPPFDDSPL